MEISGIFWLISFTAKSAEPLHRKALALYEKKYSPKDLNVAYTLTHLAEMHRLNGNFGMAEPLYIRIITILEGTHGRQDYYEFPLALNNLAEMYTAQQRFAEAEPLFKRSLAIWKENLPPDHDYVVLGLINLAQLYHIMKMDDEAEQYWKQAVKIKPEIQWPGSSGL